MLPLGLLTRRDFYFFLFMITFNGVRKSAWGESILDVEFAYEVNFAPVKLQYVQNHIYT